MYKAAGCGHTMDCEGGPAPTAMTERSIHTMENRSENRSTNCKNQTSNRTSSKTTNSATNEHKHPNQYTKGADDESAKNSTNSRSSNAKNSR